MISKNNEKKIIDHVLGLLEDTANWHRTEFNRNDVGWRIELERDVIHREKLDPYFEFHTPEIDRFIGNTYTLNVTQQEFIPMGDGNYLGTIVITMFGPNNKTTVVGEPIIVGRLEYPKEHFQLRRLIPDIAHSLRHPA